MNLNVSTMMFVVVEEWNEFDSSAILTMLQALDFFERICINKLFMVLLSSWVFHCGSCVYSHLGLPLLSPTNVNGLCGAKQAVRRHYLDSYLLQDQRLDP